MSSAPERRIVFSKRRERRVSVSEGRDGSIEGERMGDNSVVIVKRPSKGRSENGVDPRFNFAKCAASACSNSARKSRG